MDQHVLATINQGCLIYLRYLTPKHSDNNPATTTCFMMKKKLSL